MARAGIALLCAAALAIPALLAGPRRAAGPGTGVVTVFADADATVGEATPDTNAGEAATLRAGASPVLESYVRLSPAGLVGTVTSARLRLWVVDASLDGPALYPTDPGWTETGITWATKPGRTEPMVADLEAITAGTWVEYDVTSLVHGYGSYAFVLAGQSQDRSDFASREAPAKWASMTGRSTTSPPPWRHSAGWRSIRTSTRHRSTPADDARTERPVVGQLGVESGPK